MPNGGSGRATDAQGILLSVAFASGKLSFVLNWVEYPRCVGYGPISEPCAQALNLDQPFRLLAAEANV